jgi:ABC-2 type transport system permease protein
MYWRSFKTATWLGWQVEANWTKPVLFVLYTLVRPLALTGILVVLFATASRDGFGSPMFAYMYIGNAFYTYVGAVMTGMTVAVIDDRERYHTLRSIYVAPLDMRWYAGGRGMARFLTATTSVVVMLAVGVTFLRVPVHLRTVNWPLFVVAFATGIAMLAMFGLMLTGVALVLPDNSWSLGEAVAGAFYLFSGAIFPITVLPRALRPIGLAIPTTYWLELLRRSLLGSAPSLRTLSQFSDLELLVILVGLTVILSVAALSIFRWCDWVARERGMIDRLTSH